MNRLPVKYVPDAPELSRWLAFLGQLLEPESYIRLEKGTHATSKQLYSAYNHWREDNLEKPLGERTPPSQNCIETQF